MRPPPPEMTCGFLIDLFTDTGHVKLIRFTEYYGVPRGMSTFRLYFRAILGTFFLKFFLE